MLSLPDAPSQTSAASGRPKARRCVAICVFSAIGRAGNVVSAATTAWERTAESAPDFARIDHSSGSERGLLAARSNASSNCPVAPSARICARLRAGSSGLPACSCRIAARAAGVFGSISSPAASLASTSVISVSAKAGPASDKIGAKPSTAFCGFPAATSIEADMADAGAADDKPPRNTA